MTPPYVVTINNYPCAVAATLEAAQAHAVTEETRYTGTDHRELTWNKHRPDEWRLMSRVRDASTGKGRGRFAWTGRTVYGVPTVSEATPDGGVA